MTKKEQFINYLKEQGLLKLFLPVIPDKDTLVFYRDVFITTFQLWCLNLAILFCFIMVLPLLVKPQYILIDIWNVIVKWITHPYQINYLVFCFFLSLYLTFLES